MASKPRRRAGKERRPSHAPNPGVWPGYAAGGMPAHCRIVLVDDHVVVRDGLAALLGLEPDLEVIGCAGDVTAGTALIRASSPHLIICDLNMPGLSGGQALRSLRLAFPDIRLLVLTAHVSLEYVRAAFIAGAIGYVCKDAPRSELLRAIRRAAAGKRTVCGAVWDSVVGDWLEGDAPPERPEPTAHQALDDNSRRVVRLIALGVPTWRIAEELGRGVKVTEKYRMALMKRLGLRSAAAVTRFAVDHRLVSSVELDNMLEEKTT